MTGNIFAQTEELMKKSIDKLKSEFSTIRTGRATPSLVDSVKVECYNSVMPLSQVAGVSVPDAKTIEIRPWDASILSAIEKGILQSKVGLTPINDGKFIRLSIPPLTEERRKELIKQILKIAEDFKVSIRNDRRQAIETLKKDEKDKKISKDERFKLEEKLQNITDIYTKKIDEITAGKQKEIME